MGKKGALFVATGERYRREAAAAVRYLQRTNPGVPVTVFGDVAEPLAGCGPHTVVLLAEPAFSFRDKPMAFLDAPSDRNVFLDCDAFVSADLAAVHSPGLCGNRFDPYEPKRISARACSTGARSIPSSASRRARAVGSAAGDGRPSPTALRR